MCQRVIIIFLVCRKKLEKVEKQKKNAVLFEKVNKFRLLQMFK